MADAPQLPPSHISDLVVVPGIRRDGTLFDGNQWSDGQWARFQRGRPRKMGGYRALNDDLLAPIRAVHIDSRGASTTAHTCSPWGVEQLTIDDTGAVVGLADRTPVGFNSNLNYAWQTAQMFQSGGGGTPTLIACATPDLAQIQSDTAGPIYSGDITGAGALTEVSDGSPITVSGGICVLQPFLFVYGSNGLIRNSNPNDISAGSGWTTGGANKAATANVAGTKIVKGLPMRGGGASPAGVFWALDALIRVTFVGGTTLWNYDTVSTDISILAKNSVVEFDNAYYWIGTDRFYVYNGVVQELPNQLNFNWFYDNLNFAQRQKIFAVKVPRFGEIWWFFPFGDDTECTAAIIYNVREKVWYDTRLARTGGSSVKVYQYPLMAETTELNTVALSYTPVLGAFKHGEVVTGGTSGAVGTITKATADKINLVSVTGTFVNGETIADAEGDDTGTVSAEPFFQDLGTLWEHESGTDKVFKQTVEAIDSYIESCNLSWLVGSPTQAAPEGVNYQVRLSRLEPDFVMSGQMTFTVKGRSYAQGAVVESEPYTFDANTEFVDPREQRRELTIKFRSNEAGGTFQFGRVLLTLEPGDERG